MQHRRTIVVLSALLAALGLHAGVAAAPAAPTITTPASGASLASTAVAVTGTAEADALVEVFEGTASKGTTTADGTGAWTLAATFAEGAHTITAKATDAAGNTGPASEPRTFKVDLTAPAAPAITDPPEGTVLYSASVTVRGTAEQGATVLLFEGATQIASAATAASGFWTATPTLADGPHTVTARAQDAAGNLGPPSAPRSFTVESGAPPAPTVAIEDGGDEEFTSIESPEVTITGTRSQNTRVVITVSDLVEDTHDVVLETPTGAGAYSVTGDLSGLAFGRVTATAVAVNLVGHPSAAAADTSRFVPDDSGGPVPPRVQILDIDGVLSPAYDDLRNVGIDVTHLGPSATAEVTLDVTDGVTHLTAPMGTLSLDTAAHATVNVTGLRDGTITATARVTAPAPVDGSDTSKLDTKTPASSFGASTSTCISVGIIGFSTCSLTGTSTDATTGILLVFVTGENNDTGETFARLAALDNPESRTVTWRLTGGDLASLGIGRWTFEAHAQDVAGNFEETTTSSMDVLVL